MRKDMWRTEEPLFAGPWLRELLDAERDRSRAAVDAVSPDLLLDRSDEGNVAALLEALRLEPVELHWSQVYSTGVEETKVDVQHDWRYGQAQQGRPVMVDATSVTAHVPYTGDTELLRRRPSHFSSSNPQVVIDVGEIRWSHIQPGLTEEQITKAFEGFQRQAQQAEQFSRADVEGHNRALEDLLRRHVSARRDRLLQQRQVAGALPFPIRPAGAAPTFPLPVRRTKVHLTAPKPAAPFQPEPALENAVYEDVLGRVVAWGNAVERTPQSVGALDEEGLRDQLLVALNLAYEGQAAGEVFNRSGKTDITLRQADRNAFIAECKIWRGAASVGKAVDQLLEYLVWRDSKAALILFIKSGLPSEVVAKADAAITAHPACQRRLEPAQPDRRVDYLLRSTADPARSIRTALLPLVIGPFTT